MRNPLLVTLEAHCKTYADALKLQAMISDFITNEELAGEHIQYAEIHYVDPQDIERQNRIDLDTEELVIC